MVFLLICDRLLEATEAMKLHFVGNKQPVTACVGQEPVTDSVAYVIIIQRVSW